MSLWFALSWAFVFGVTGYDIAWATHYRETAGFWEVNPIARQLFSAGGIFLAGSVRVLTVVFAFAVVAAAPHRTRARGTAAVVLIHAYLAATYVAVILEMS